MKRVATIFALVLAASFCTGTALARTDKNNTTVTRVYSNANTLLIQLQSGQSGEGCSSNSWAEIEANDPNARELFNIALSAYLSGREVSVRLEGCNYYPEIHYIYLR